MASRWWLRPRGSPRTQFRFKESCAKEVEPKGAFPQGFAPNGLLIGLSLGLCRRGCAEGWVPARVRAPRSPQRSTHGLLACRCRLAVVGLRAAVRLPRPPQIRISQCLCPKHPLFNLMKQGKTPAPKRFYSLFLFNIFKNGIKMKA